MISFVFQFFYLKKTYQRSFVASLLRKTKGVFSLDIKINITNVETQNFASLRQHCFYPISYSLNLLFARLLALPEAEVQMVLKRLALQLQVQPEV
jgi:hypothetical protein